MECNYIMRILYCNKAHKFIPKIKLEIPIITYHKIQGNCGIKVEAPVPMAVFFPTYQISLSILKVYLIYDTFLRPKTKKESNV